jgi:anti-sigma regulatory factor (Ser/Thr protein kinase)
VRTGAAAGHVGFFHEALLYETDEELLALLIPHLDAGVGAGEPTIACLFDEQAHLVRGALADPSAVTFLAPLTVDDRPPSALRQFRSVMDEHLAHGAEQARIINTVPHPGLGVPWDDWRRYEAAVNLLFSAMPVWGLCLYDRRIASEVVLRDVVRTHPRLLTPQEGHVVNERYEDPLGFLRASPPSAPHRLESGPTLVELVDPVPADIRDVIRLIAVHTRLTPERVDELLVATTEVLSNAWHHGVAPVTVKAWATTGQIMVTVTDHGPGPSDALVGLMPRARSATGAGGLGLWIVHQLVDVAYRRDEEGFTCRLIARASHAD